MPRVLVTPTVIRNVPGPYSEQLHQHGFEVKYPPKDADTFQSAVMIEQLQGCQAMLASTERLTREVLAQSELRAIARMGVGFDAIDIPAATDLGIAVTITPGVLEESVAEHTIAMMLGVSRGVVQRDREVRQGVWTRQPLPRLAGKTLGLLGLGRIGRAVVPRARGLGMHVIAHDPLADANYCANNDVRLVTLEELLSAADVVSLHLPCTPETENLMNARTFAQMKPGAIFLNTSRGGLVDEDALSAVLASGRLLGAGLDVFRTEPLPRNHPLMAFENVLLCTHMGGLDHESLDGMGLLAAQCVVDLYEGRWPERCVVNPAVREKWRW
jgi:D-3-phosphoglycerate dehydrogenase/(S)-sulfolactate dehydrogenase